MNCSREELLLRPDVRARANLSLLEGSSNDSDQISRDRELLLVVVGQAAVLLECRVLAHGGTGASGHERRRNRDGDSVRGLDCGRVLAREKGAGKNGLALRVDIRMTLSISLRRLKPLDLRCKRRERSARFGQG